jgi:hypothetical protein
MTGEKSNTFSFGLKGACGLCHQERVVEAARPYWERVSVKNGNQETFSDVLRPVTRETVKRALENAVWVHCGVTDRPSEDLLAAFQQRMGELIGSLG